MTFSILDYSLGVYFLGKSYLSLGVAQVFRIAIGSLEFAVDCFELTMGWLVLAFGCLEVTLECLELTIGYLELQSGV